ncbi:MAG: translocation/assembly module TamB domain-containing protein [Bryobacteraceae bacterium]
MTRLAKVAPISLGIVLIAGIAGVAIARSDWLRRELRAKIVHQLETSTGGKVDIGAFRLDWTTLTAEIDDLAIHGLESAAEPPLARVAKVRVAVQIASFLNPIGGFSIASLELDRPEAHLIVYQDGRTNMPEPKVAKKSQVINLKIGRFHARNGTFEVKSPGNPPKITPWDARGENLQSLFTYQAAGHQYHGVVGIHPLQLRWGASGPLPLDVKAIVAIGKNRAQVTNATLATKQSQMTFSGTVDNFSSPRAALDFTGKFSIEELGRILALQSGQSGTVDLTGAARYSGAMDYSVTGKLHAADVSYRDKDIHLEHVRVDSSIDATPKKVALTNLKIGAPGGDITGKAEILGGKTFKAEGNLARFDVRRLGALASAQRLPYDGSVSGPFQVSGELAKPAESLQASAKLTIAPSGTGVPVSGAIDANYTKGAVELTNANISLPNTRVMLSGALGTGLQVHLASTNLGDLPGLDLPVKLQNGSAQFDGTVAGSFADPRIMGHVAVRNAIYSGQKIDALSADVDLQKSDARVRNGLLTLGTARASVQGSVGLHNWKPEENQPLTANVSVRNANLAALLKLAGQKNIPATGALTATAHITGTAGNPHATADLSLVKGSIEGEPFDRIEGKLDYLNGGTQTGNFKWNAGRGQINLKAAFEHAPANFLAGRLNFQVSSNRVPLEQYRSMVSGSAQINATGAVTLSKSKIEVAALDGNVDIVEGKIYDEPFDHLTLKLDSPDSGLQIAAGQLDAGPERINVKASFQHAAANFEEGRIAFEVASNRLSLARIHTLQNYRPGISGTMQLRANGEALMSQSGTGKQFQLAKLDADATASSVDVEGKALGDAHLTAKTQGTALTAHLESDIAHSSIRGDGAWQLTGEYPGSAKVMFSKVDVAALDALAAPASARKIAGTVDGTLDISGPAAKPAAWTASLDIPAVEVKPGPASGVTPPNVPNLALRNSGPIRLSIAKSIVRIDNMHFVAQSTDIQVRGSVNLANRKSALDLRVIGNLNLGLLHALDNNVTSSGTLIANANIRGALNAPLVGGRMQLRNVNLNLADVPNGLTNANGAIVFDGTRATVQELTAESGGGKVKVGGFVAYEDASLAFRLTADATGVRIRYPEGVSTVANAALNLTGTTDRSLLSGDITILRTGFNPRTDLGSVISGSAAPVQTPAARSGLFSNMQFNVQIATAPDISFQAAQAEGLQAEANLRLRGTVSNPVLLGRVNITQGDLTFFGNKYVITQGSISFFNPVKLEPILNIDLETRARGVDVTLTVSGTPSKLNVTYRSDPPLQFSDIVALLATGRAPADPSIAARQTGPPQTWQQMGASALVGQAIANPVAGRLQRFFGVSKLKIDPLVAGVGGRSQTRLTIEQQVTPDITFTYITDVSSTNPQIVRVEWAINKNWSAVAIRDETSSFGIDFLYKKRFK